MLVTVDGRVCGRQGHGPLLLYRPDPAAPPPGRRPALRSRHRSHWLGHAATPGREVSTNSCKNGFVRIRAVRVSVTWVGGQAVGDGLGIHQRSQPLQAMDRYGLAECPRESVAWPGFGLNGERCPDQGCEWRGPARRGARTTASGYRPTPCPGVLRPLFFRSRHPPFGSWDPMGT